MAQPIKSVFMFCLQRPAKPQNRSDWPSVPAALAQAVPPQFAPVAV
jgi:hypothetical protein